MQIVYCGGMDLIVSKYGMHWQTIALYLMPNTAQIYGYVVSYSGAKN